MTRAKLLVTICQIEWSRSLEYAQLRLFKAAQLRLAHNQHCGVLALEDLSL